MPRRILGLCVTYRQPHEPKVFAWQEFLKLAEVAARIAAKVGPVKADDLPRVCDRCQFISKKRGTQCKHEPMRGATRCKAHGGPRQVPHHPVTVEMWNRGDIEARAQAVREAAELQSRCHARSAPKVTNTTAEVTNRRVGEVMNAAGLYHAGPHGRKGRRAMRYGTPADWQAWLAETHQMAAEMKGREHA